MQYLPLHEHTEQPPTAEQALNRHEVNTQLTAQTTKPSDNDSTGRRQLGTWTCTCM